MAFCKGCQCGKWIWHIWSFRLSSWYTPGLTSKQGSAFGLCVNDKDGFICLFGLVQLYRFKLRKGFVFIFFYQNEKCMVAVTIDVRLKIYTDTNAFNWIRSSLSDIGGNSCSSLKVIFLSITNNKTLIWVTSIIIFHPWESSQAYKALQACCHN